MAGRPPRAGGHCFRPPAALVVLLQLLHAHASSSSSGLPRCSSFPSTNRAASTVIAFARGGRGGRGGGAPRAFKLVDEKPGPVPRVDAREFLGRREEFERLALESPVVLTHAFDEALRGSGGGDSGGGPLLRRFATDEEFSDRFFDAFADVECAYQVKANGRGAKPRIYEGPLAEVVGGMMAQSHHDEAWYLLSEDLLDTASDAALRSPLVLPPALFGASDWFDLFPVAVRPKKSCVILGGPGARSFLHVDPYEWTGVNYLFEGRKLWTFIRPSAANEESLGLVRFKPDAWSAELGAGWKSDTVDLYHAKPRVSGDGDQRDLIALGLAPTLAAALPPQDVVACVQEEGDLVVIPPRWAHQVYHLTPALGLAWQVANRANIRRVLRHVLEYCVEERDGAGAAVDVATVLQEVMGATLPPAASEEEELPWARSRIQAGLMRALEVRHGGKEKGLKEWARLQGQQP